MKHIVITGSTKGIGFGLAREFVRRGHSVIITGRTSAACEAAAEKLEPERAGEAKVVTHACDVSDAPQLDRLWRRGIDILGRIDIWINNAGLAKTTYAIKDLPSEHVEPMVRTNMLGTMNGSRVAVRGMLAQGGGQVFNVLGGGSDGRIMRGMGVYGSTKQALKYFTDALEGELKGSCVQVGQIKPGMLITEGVRREAGEMGAERFQETRKIFNILFDEVDTVAPYLADRVLATDEHGARIAWMTPTRAAGRFLTAPLRKRDVLTKYDL